MFSSFVIPLPSSRRVRGFLLQLLTCSLIFQHFVWNMDTKTCHKAWGKCLIQCVVKNLKPLGVFLNSMHQNKKVLWELWDKIRMNFSSWAHGQIQMHVNCWIWLYILSSFIIQNNYDCNISNIPLDCAFIQCFT
jgi:hypothetical protein